MTREEFLAVLAEHKQETLRMLDDMDAADVPTDEIIDWHRRRSVRLFESFGYTADQMQL